MESPWCSAYACVEGGERGGLAMNQHWEIELHMHLMRFDVFHPLGTDVYT